MNLSIFGKSVENIQCSFKSNKNNGTLHEYMCTVMTKSRSFLIRLGNFSDMLYSKLKHSIKFNMCLFTKIVPFMK